MALSDLFGHWFGENGALHVGLAVSQEESVPATFRIPVPRNFSLPAEASEAAVIRTAKWAYDFQLARNSNDHGRLFAISAYMAYSTGCVAIEGPTPSAGETKPDVLALLKWDSEVDLIDEDVPDIGKPLTVPEAEPYRLPVDDRELAVTLVTYVIAAKMSWWSTKHHLGARSSNPTSGSSHEWVGFLAKCCRAKPIDGLGYDNDADRTRLYRVVHTWSTKAVFKQLTVSKQYRTTILPVKPIPGHFYKEPGKETPVWKTPPFLKITPSEDVSIRIGSAGAGYANVFDSVAALRQLSATVIFVGCPGRDQIGVLAEAYSTARRDPYAYGLSAAYLTGSRHTPVFDISSISTLIAGLVTFVDRVRKRSSLAGAAIFSKNPTDIDGYSEAWDRICCDYKREANRGAGINSDMIKKLMASAGAGINADASNVGALSNHMALMGIAFNSDNYAKAVDIVKTAQAPPDGDEERAEDAPSDE